MMDDNQCYYSPYKRKENLVTVICWQWFDKYDYDENNFFYDDDNNIIQFTDEKQAIDWINENVQEKYIEPCYISPKSMLKRHKEVNDATEET